jgi:hypothetical protein
MKLAVISDTHLGDPMCTLFYMKQVSPGYKNVHQGDRYQKFAEAAGTGNDYLILVGDIIDFAIESYEDAYAVAGAFFQKVKDDGIANEIIYIPGNHDFDIWHTVEHQVRVIKPISGHVPVGKFLWSVAGHLDDRPARADTRLATYLFDRNAIDKIPAYADLYLNKITVPDTSFQFCYPNLYLVTDEGKSIIITHGHYLEAVWPMIGEWAVKVFGKQDLNVERPLNLVDMASVNFPMCQLMSSGVGQAGALTDLIQSIQQETKNHNLGNIKRYLNNFIKAIADYKYLSLLKKAALIPVLLAGKYLLLNSLSKFNDARYDREILDKPEVQDRFWNYYGAGRKEIDMLNSNYKLDIPLPLLMIFGHTHCPLPWKNIPARVLPGRLESDKKDIVLFNTGGWLNRHDKEKQIEFCGARVYKYETGKGITSVAVE